MMMYKQSKINFNMNKFIVIFYILLSINLTKITCEPDKTGLNNFNSNSKRYISVNNHESINDDKEKHKSISEVDDVGKDDVVLIQLEQDYPKQLYSRYHESYISKEAAKKFRQRFKTQKKPYTDKDYEDFIQELDVTNNKQQNKASDIYDKKYFDYLPAEEGDEIGGEKQRTKLHKKYNHNHKRQNSRRNKRDTLQENNEKNIQKRQAGYYYMPQFLEHERRAQMYQYLPPSPVYSGYPVHFAPTVYYPTYVNPNNPWNNGNPTIPHLNNFYLPVQPPNMNYNPGTPPKNPTKKPGMTFDNRFDGPVWDVYENPNSIQTVDKTTRRPPPSLIRGQSVDNQVTTKEPTVTRRPPPSLIRGNSSGGTTQSRPGTSAKKQDDFLVKKQQPSTSAPQTTPRPQFQPITTRAPQSFTPQQNTGPSKCVWGIVNCCKRGNLAVRYSCFEQMGCGGAFWDYNPCSDSILNAAIDETNRYFDE